jgi:hypothetical protein
VYIEYIWHMANFTWLVYKPTTQPFVLTLNAEPKTIGSELSLQSSILSLAAYSAHNTRDQRSRESPFYIFLFLLSNINSHHHPPPPEPQNQNHPTPLSSCLD